MIDAQTPWCYFKGVKTGYSNSFMTLHQLRVFLTVAKLGSFTQAARALHVVQPSVSAMVQELKEELGIDLFQRFGNKFRLTTAGEMVLREAEEIVARADGLKDKVDEVRGLKKGRLRVGGSALAGVSILPVVVQKFKREHPGVEVMLTIERSESLEKKILNGELDVALLGIASRSSLLMVEPYREEEIVVIAPPNHPLTKKRSVSLELLAKEPLVVSEKSGLVQTMLEQRFAESGLLFAPSLQIDVQGGGRDPAKNAVARGLGIGFTSKPYVVSEIKAGRLKILKVPELNLKRIMHIAVHKNQQSSPLVQAFIDFLKRYKDWQGRALLQGLSWVGLPSVAATLL